MDKIYYLIIGVICGGILYFLIDFQINDNVDNVHLVDSLRVENRLLRLDVEYYTKDLVALDSSKVVLSSTHVDRLDRLDSLNVDSLFRLLNREFLRR